MTETMYTVGKLVNTQGLRGEVRVLSHTDFPEERFKKGNKLWLIHPEMKSPLLLIISGARLHKNFYLLTFEGYDSIDAVEKFKGGELKVPESELLDLEEGQYYHHEIVDCEVYTEQGELLGKVKEILIPGANDVWVIKRPKEKDLLIPVIDEVIKEVNPEQKKIIVHLIDGLL